MKTLEPYLAGRVTKVTLHHKYLRLFIAIQSVSVKAQNQSKLPIRLGFLLGHPDDSLIN